VRRRTLVVEQFAVAGGTQILGAADAESHPVEGRELRLELPVRRVLRGRVAGRTRTTLVVVETPTQRGIDREQIYAVLPTDQWHVELGIALGHPGSAAESITPLAGDVGFQVVGTLRTRVVQGVLVQIQAK